MGCADGLLACAQEAAKQKQTLSTEEKQSIQAPILEAQDAAEAAQDQKSEGPTMSLNMVCLVLLYLLVFLCLFGLFLESHSIQPTIGRLHMALGVSQGHLMLSFARRRLECKGVRREARIRLDWSEEVLWCRVC